MWKLRKYLVPYWKASVLAPLFMMLEVAMDLMQPMLMASIVNHGVMESDIVHIQQTGLLMLVVAVIGMFAGFACTIFSSRAAMQFSADLRMDLFAKVQSFSFRQLDLFKSGSLITRLTNDVAQLQQLVQMSLRAFVRGPLIIVGSIIMTFIINPSLAIIVVVTISTLIILIYLLIRFASPLFSKLQKKLDNVNTTVQENVSNIRAVKSFVRSDYENKRFARVNQDFTQTAIKAFRIMALNMPIVSLILYSSVVLILWFGAHQAWQGNMPVGDLIAFINYVIQVLFSLLMIGNLMMMVTRGRASAERVNDVFSVSVDTEDVESHNNEVLQGKVNFENVSFSYGDGQKEKTIENINLSICPGKRIAIVGSTGAGKSTLVQLLLRLYEPTSGTIYIDGKDIRDIPLSELRKRIAIVSQNPFLFSGTIKENICFGLPNASEEEIIKAAKMAQAHEFIDKLPGRYDARIGQKGVNLSGGQKQRISIARALLLQPKILILDDSTSAVDTATEMQIQQEIRQQLDGCTCIMIAQRISSVINADTIVVMEHGRILSQGSHEQLLHDCRIYQEIYQSQFRNGGLLNGY
ncbi:ABC transporter ATP-binding protein [Desulfuribacillus alkaliarsenatis]|uniref:Multidrug ABC transporter ATP-binding protein n=1 Tax=Desulfuribacillus alkaliarsenatis TaxID=766136 RepID=A0A1E5G401_9FIRM|nr:ABC transporter ATP-binding protein [Desulfuribacillus alkaliarsenatis]OEF97399.1 multidrug ABC transporter ATP-binding protein [Desulfuribacillus alkaliarsenatis]